MCLHAVLFCAVAAVPCIVRVAISGDHGHEGQRAISSDDSTALATAGVGGVGGGARGGGDGNNDGATDDDVVAAKMMNLYVCMYVC